jgi:thymidylate kinase
MSSRVGPSPPSAGRAGLPLTVEFIGTPGSGKTTLSIELVRLLQEQGISAATVLSTAREHAARTIPGQLVMRLAPRSLRRALLWQVFYLVSMIHALGFGSENTELARHVLRIQLRSPLPMALRRHRLFWFFQLAGRYRFLMATSREREGFVLDDGFLHRSVALNTSHVDEPDLRQVEAYVDLLPMPDLVIVTTAELSTCERRVRERGVWPHHRLSSAELAHYLANAQTVVRAAVRRARERGWNVVELRNEGRGLDRAKSDLRAALAPLVASPCFTQALRTGQPS